MNIYFECRSEGLDLVYQIDRTFFLEKEVNAFLLQRMALLAAYSVPGNNYRSSNVCSLGNDWWPVFFPRDVVLFEMAPFPLISSFPKVLIPHPVVALGTYYPPMWPCVGPVAGQGPPAPCPGTHLQIQAALPEDLLPFTFSASLGTQAPSS